MAGVARTGGLVRGGVIAVSARLSTTAETQVLDDAWSRLHQLLGARLQAA